MTTESSCEHYGIIISTFHYNIHTCLILSDYFLYQSMAMGNHNVHLTIERTKMIASSKLLPSMDSMTNTANIGNNKAAILA